MNENLLSVFKKELGYVNATNQYIELSVRITEKEHSLDLKDGLKDLAKSVNLNVSTLTEDYMCRISKSYIVNIQSCFENFLKSFKDLPGSPTNIIQKHKSKDEDWLSWTLNTAFSNIESSIKIDIDVCEYYRLIRNYIIHNGKVSASIKSKYDIIKIVDNSKLDAPNRWDSLKFDDQVLFSRTAYRVAKYIFENSKYDINTIIEGYKKSLISLAKPFQEPDSHSKAKIKYFISLLYPELTNVDWEDEVDKLFSD